MSKFEYIDFAEPKPCLFKTDGKEYEAMAIAHSGNGMIRLKWGVELQQETSTPFCNVELLPVCKPSLSVEEVEQGLKEGWIVSTKGVE